MADQAMSEAYRNADNGGRQLIAASWALLALTTVFFLLFLVSRLYNEGAIGRLMFWLIIAAYLFNTGNSVDNALSAYLGDAGKHVDTLDHATNIASGKIGKAADYLYIPSAILPKLAMLAFYHQVFPSRTYRYITYGCAGLLICTLLAGFLQCTFICQPFDAYWTGDCKCGNLIETYRWLSYPNLFTDIVMLVLPFPVLWTLHVSTGTKVKLIVTFLTGSMGIVTAALRMVSFYRVPIFSDPMWYLIEPSIYSVVEPSAYLMCAIMPTLRHLTRRVARFAGISSSMGYHSSCSPSGASRGMSGRMRSRLNSASRPAGKGVTELADLEMQAFEDRAGWNKIGADGSVRGKHGGIMCKTDVDVLVESTGERTVYGMKGAASSRDSKSLAEARDAFGDEIPLQVRSGC